MTPKKQTDKQKNPQYAYKTEHLKRHTLELKRKESGIYKIEKPGQNCNQRDEIKMLYNHKWYITVIGVYRIIRLTKIQ